MHPRRLTPGEIDYVISQLQKDESLSAEDMAKSLRKRFGKDYSDFDCWRRLGQISVFNDLFKEDFYKYKTAFELEIKSYKKFPDLTEAQIKILLSQNIDDEVLFETKMATHFCTTPYVKDILKRNLDSNIEKVAYPIDILILKNQIQNVKSKIQNITENLTQDNLLELKKHKEKLIQLENINKSTDNSIGKDKRVSI